MTVVKGLWKQVSNGHKKVMYWHRWIHDYQDACVDKLEKFVTGAANETLTLASSASASTGCSSASPARLPLTGSGGLFRPHMTKTSSLASQSPEPHHGGGPPQTAPVSGPSQPSLSNGMETTPKAASLGGDGLLDG